MFVRKILGTCNIQTREQKTNQLCNKSISSASDLVFFPVILTRNHRPILSVGGAASYWTWLIVYLLDQIILVLFDFCFILAPAAELLKYLQLLKSRVLFYSKNKRHTNTRQRRTVRTFVRFRFGQFCVFFFLFCWVILLPVLFCNIGFFSMSVLIHSPVSYVIYAFVYL